jgi:hypothetical protein
MGRKECVSCHGNRINNGLYLDFYVFFSFTSESSILEER